MTKDTEQEAEIERIKREHPGETIDQWSKRLAAWERERYLTTGKGGGYFRLLHPNAYRFRKH